MAALIKVTSIPFQSTRFTQNARLVPSQSVAAERQRTFSLYHAYQNQYHVKGNSSSLDFMSKYRQTFSSGSPVAISPQNSGANLGTAPSVSAASQKSMRDSDTISALNYPSSRQADSVSVNGDEPAAVSSGNSESVSEYLVQREAFEFRIAKGDLSYIPAMSVTIITQYPEVQFEYLGDFNYVPPRKDAAGGLIDIQA